MLNRAIDRGCGLIKYQSAGIESCLSGDGGIRPITYTTFLCMERSNIKYDFTPKSSSFIDTEPISGNLNTLPSVSVKLISGSDFESLWDQLVSSYHYLGYQKLLGHRLKYLVFMKDRPVAALSWSAPALKLAARDCFRGSTMVVSAEKHRWTDQICHLQYTQKYPLSRTHQGIHHAMAYRAMLSGR